MGVTSGDRRVPLALGVPPSDAAVDIVLDIGNTETAVGWFADGHLVGHGRLASDARRTADEWGLWLRQLLAASSIAPDRVRSVTVASVVPALTPLWADATVRHFGVHVGVVDARCRLPIRLEVEEPLSVGADRIVNTVAAAHLYATDCIVVDLGTATTFDCVTADGAFVGGVIAPGVQTAADNLTARAAKLPRVELVRPERVVGRRTETALQSGIFFGAVDAIDGLVERIRAEWGRPSALVVATGGLCSLVAPHCRTVSTIEPFLTLYGIWLARSCARSGSALERDLLSLLYSG